MPLRTLSRTARRAIIAWEVIGLGAVTLVVTLGSVATGRSNLSATSLDWLYVGIGIALVLVGMEASALNREP